MRLFCISTVLISLTCAAFAGEDAKKLPGEELIHGARADGVLAAEILFRAGKFELAEEMFRAELAIPQSSDFDGCPVGHTPKLVRVRIWLARCHGRLGQQEAALKESLQLVRETKGVWKMWSKTDRARLAKTVVENAKTPEQMAEVEEFAKTEDFKEVLEYFAAIAWVNNGDAAGVVRYLTRSDVPVGNVDPPLWRDEIVEKATDMKPEILGYTRGQIERASQWQDTEMNMYHLHHLLQVLPDKSFVEPCLGSRTLKRRFPDDYRRWMDILKVFRLECKKTAIRHFKGDRDGKEHALDLINALQLYDRDLLDQIAVVAREDYYPLQVRSLLALWRVSGEQFGLEAATTELALQEPSDADRRTALVQAVDWWKRKKAELPEAAQVSVQTVNPDVLEKGLRCRLWMIRSDAINQLEIARQRMGEKKGIESSDGGHGDSVNGKAGLSKPMLNKDAVGHERERFTWGQGRIVPGMTKADVAKEIELTWKRPNPDPFRGMNIPGVDRINEVIFAQDTWLLSFGAHTGGAPGGGHLQLQFAEDELIRIGDLPTPAG